MVVGEVGVGAEDVHGFVEAAGEVEGVPGSEVAVEGAEEGGAVFDELGWGRLVRVGVCGKGERTVPLMST